MINRSIDYIINHLDDQLTVRHVAAQFKFSSSYFSRLFKAETGNSIYSFIKQCKLNQSAIDLKLKQGKKITEIAWEYGYSSSNYSTAFRERHQSSPADFRRGLSNGTVRVPFTPERKVFLKNYRDYAALIEVRELADLHVLYERFIGSYEEIKDCWRSFIDRHKGIIDEDTVFIEYYYDDPSITEVDCCICDLCLTVTEGFLADNTKVISGHRYAVYPYKGLIEDIFESVQGVYSVWLPQSGYTMSERFGLHRYHTMDFERGWVSMDLCIPI